MALPIAFAYIFSENLFFSFLLNSRRKEILSMNIRPCKNDSIIITSAAIVWLRHAIPSQRETVLCDKPNIGCEAGP